MAASKPSGNSPSTVTISAALVLLVVGACDVVVVTVVCVVAIGGAVVEAGAAAGAAAGVDVHAPAKSTRETTAARGGMSRFTGRDRTREADESRGLGAARDDR